MMRYRAWKNRDGEVGRTSAKRAWEDKRSQRIFENEWEKDERNTPVENYQ